MKLIYIDFLKKLILFTLALGILTAVTSFLLPSQYLSPALPFLFFFFFSITLVVHLILIKVSQKRATAFINYFMLLTFGKLFFFLTVIIIYAVLNRIDAVPFIISFFLLYLFYTAFEVVLILTYLNTTRKEGRVSNP
jgi:hypothetical protein